MIVKVDLHAAKINQDLALSLGFAEFVHCVDRRISNDGLAFNIQGVGVKAALDASFRKTHCIENPERNILRLRNRRKIKLTDSGIRRTSGKRYVRCRSRQPDRGGKATRQQPLSDPDGLFHKPRSAG